MVLSLCIGNLWAGYIPTRRVTTFESGKKYMIYNTTQNRSGFLYVGLKDDGTGTNVLKKWTTRTFGTNNTAFLWNVTTDASGHLNLQNVATGKYYGLDFAANNAQVTTVYLYPWGDLTGKQAAVASQNEDDPTQYTASGNITFEDNKVFVIGGASDGTVFWNGNSGDIVTWTSGHPFAFYEVEETEDVFSTAHVGTNSFQATKLSIGASNHSMTKDASGNVTITPSNTSSGYYGANNQRFFCTLVVKIDVPETTTAGPLCEMRQASGNTTYSQGLYMDANRVLKTSWQGKSYGDQSTTVDAGEHTIIYTAGSTGAEVYVDGVQKFTVAGLKAGSTYKSIYIPANYADYVREVYFFDGIVGSDDIANITTECNSHIYASQQSGTTADVPTGKTLILDKAVNWTSLTGTGTVLQSIDNITTNVAGALPALTLKATAGTLNYTGPSLTGTTLDGVVLAGNQRITTSGEVSIKNLAGNNLTAGTNDYAFVGSGTISFYGTCDLTKKADGTGTAFSKLGYGKTASIAIMDGATLTTGGIFNATTSDNNAPITIETGGKLIVPGTTSTQDKGIVLSKTFTNNGTLELNAGANISAISGTGTVTVPEGVTATIASIANTATLTGAGSLTLGTFPTSSAPTLTDWTGTVVFPADATDKGAIDAILNAWGNANSKIILNSVGTAGSKGQGAGTYFNGSKTITPAVEIAEGATVYLNNGNSNSKGIFTKLSGAGTLSLQWTGSYTQQINNLTDFTGTLESGTSNSNITVKMLVLASAPDPNTNTLLFKTSASNVTLEKLYIGLQETTAYSWAINTVDDVTGIYVTEVDQVQLAREDAINAAAPYYNGNHVGTGVGKFTVMLGETSYSEMSDFRTAVMAWQTLSDCVEPTITINQPQVGHTYAFKGAADSHQYMIGQSSTVEGKTNRLALTATPTGNSHVFTLLEGNKLQSYTSGQYLVSTSERYLNVGDEANAVPFEFVASESQIGAYQLKYTYSTYVRTVWSMYTGYVDGADFPQSAIGYQWIIEEVEPKTTSNITYQITEDETVKWEETIEAGIGETYPAPTFSHPFVSALAGVPDGIVQDYDETFQLTYTTKYDIAPDVSNITKYYALDIHATSGNYPMYSDGQALRKETTSIDVSKYAQGSADYIYAWAFVGNIFDGIKLYNMEDQKYVCQPADDRNTHVSMTDNPDVATAFTVYNPIKTVSDTYPGTFCLKKSDFSNYLNQLGSFVGGYTSADGGSAIRAYAISEFTDATAELFDRMKNTAKFDLVAGAVVVSPSEYDEPSAINAAINAANDLPESASRIEKKNFIADDQLGRKLYNFLVQSDHYGEPVVVTYVQNRPYGTLIMPLNFACPTGWTRYYCSELTDGGRLVLTDFNDVEEEETKNRPFIIYSPETIGTTYQFIGYSGGARTEDVTIGLLTGVLSDGGSTVPQGSYVLAYQKSTGLQSFRKTDGTVTCPQYKVYLTKSPLAESRDNFYFPDVDDSATGLEELLEQSVLADGKYVRDGRVIIVKNGVKYNTNGQIIK